MSATTLSFTLTTSSKVKSVHLLGSWDGYQGQTALKPDSKPGKWRATPKFSGLKPGSRYWYYYMIDNYHVSHDPSVPSTIEPTTKRALNILNVPASSSDKRGSVRPATKEGYTGRSLSPSKIVHPKPSKPYESRRVREADYSIAPVEDLADKLEKASLYSTRNISPASSVGSSLSSRSSDRSSPSSLSSLSDPSSSGGSRCTCWGVKRSGERVKLDCGGSRCGSSDESSSACSSESEEESSEDERPQRRRAAVKPRYQEIRPRGNVASSRRR